MTDRQETVLPLTRDEIAQIIAQAEIGERGLLSQEDYDRFPIYRAAFMRAADRIMQRLSETVQQILDLIDQGGWAIGLKGDAKTIELDQPVKIVCSDYKVALVSSR